VHFRLGPRFEFVVFRLAFAGALPIAPTVSLDFPLFAAVTAAPSAPAPSSPAIFGAPF
jgi:hypothetical protein